MAQGPLKITVMKLLSEKETSGYQLMKAMTEKIGWKPSPGSMYPLLADLSKKKMVQTRIQGRQKLYRLTPYGKEVLKNLQEKRKAFVQELESNMRVYSLVGDQQEAKDMEMILRIMKDREGHLSWLHEEAVILRRMIFSLAEKNPSRKDQEKIRKIIRKTTEALRGFV